MKLDTPFPALVPAGEGLNRAPDEPVRLRARMAAVYGVPEENLIPVRGAWHGLELVLRRAKLHGYDAWVAPKAVATERLARIYGLERRETWAKGCGVRLVASPDKDGKVLTAREAMAIAVDISPAFLVVDERWIEIAEADSLASLTPAQPNLVVLRDLGFVYGLDGVRAGALIASDRTVERLEELVEPYALPVPILKAAEAALSPSRALAVESRIAEIRGERARLIEVLSGAPGVEAVEPSQGPCLWVRPRDLGEAKTALARLGCEWLEKDGRLGLPVRRAEANDRLIAAFGAATAARPRRRAEAVRDTKETRIAVTVDLDSAAPRAIRTGVGFFDHMLDQVAAHGGFALTVGCEGDLHIDPHHTIEDVALAFGQALKGALGDRAGVARFGFVLPMDETEAKVSVDLGGRPFAVFKGDFEASHIGDYPTEMTAHVFRSLSETLGAAIHVEVTGQNDHHKTEACFKALGRALRTAVRIEGEAVPSTKGVI